MRRRAFLAGIAAATSFPSVIRAQSTPKRRIGVLLQAAIKDELRVAALTSTLEKMGWKYGQNIQIDYRWTGSASTPTESIVPLAQELVLLQPDVILAQTTQVVAALQRVTKTIPIVFVSVGDPVAAGFVDSLAHPGGNITGFANSETSLFGKLVEMLKEVAPRIRQVALMFNPRLPRFGTAVEQAAQSYGVELVEAPVQSDADIERLIAGLRDSLSNGLIIIADPFLGNRQKLIVSLAARYRVPTIYPFRFFVDAGGLMSYGNDLNEQYRQAAGYINRILEGERAADLPVQLPTKYELVVNLKTASELGITFPPALLARADEVIE